MSEDRYQMDESQLRAEAVHPAPSSFDLPLIAGGQDAVLATQEAARERYRYGATANAYIGGSNSICAAGAFLAGDEGIVAQGRELRLAGLDEIGSRLRDADMAAAAIVVNSAVTAYAAYEKWASQTTREALDLVNEAAEELFPELLEEAYLKAERNDRPWEFGAIEALNQELSWEDDPDYAPAGQPTVEFEGELMPYAKYVVLSCYDEAIARRKAAQPGR